MCRYSSRITAYPWSLFLSSFVIIIPFSFMTWTRIFQALLRYLFFHISLMGLPRSFTMKERRERELGCTTIMVGNYITIHLVFGALQLFQRTHARFVIDQILLNLRNRPLIHWDPENPWISLHTVFFSLPRDRR